MLFSFFVSPRIKVGLLCIRTMATCSFAGKQHSCNERKQEIMYSQSGTIAAHDNNFVQNEPGNRSRLSKNGTISTDMDYTAVCLCHCSAQNVTNACYTHRSYFSGELLGTHTHTLAVLCWAKVPVLLHRRVFWWMVQPSDNTRVAIAKNLLLNQKSESISFLVWLSRDTRQLGSLHQHHTIFWLEDHAVRDITRRDLLLCSHHASNIKGMCCLLHPP